MSKKAKLTARSEQVKHHRLKARHAMSETVRSYHKLRYAYYRFCRQQAIARRRRGMIRKLIQKIRTMDSLHRARMEAYASHSEVQAETIFKLGADLRDLENKYDAAVICKEHYHKTMADLSSKLDSVATSRDFWKGKYKEARENHNTKEKVNENIS